MKFFTLKIIISFFLFLNAASFSQTGDWKYVQKISFPATLADSTISPYSCVVDSKDNLWIISARVTSASAHNALFKAGPEDTLLTEVVDYTAKGDTLNVRALIGLTAIDDDILVTSKCNKLIHPAGVSRGYYYLDGDTSKATLYGFNMGNAGWGTEVYGITATKDSIVFAGLAYGGTSIRGYNFSLSRTAPGYAAYIDMASLTPAEPGGPNSGGFDIIRDCAVDPNEDYNNPETVWYTSRNSLNSTSANGGIARWAGGTQTDPKSYVGQRVTDASSDLSVGSWIPYGITIDNKHKLWVAGIDTTRRWVKAFEVDNFNFANAVEELPAQYSTSNPDPNGAPLRMPTDVAFTKDGYTAYVIDAAQKAAYRFSSKPTGVENEKTQPILFALKQNYPNPFNPSTVISYSLPKGMNVKLVVTNSLGQEIATLIDGFKLAGNYSKTFNAQNLSSGIYFYTLKADNLMFSKKMMLVR